MQELYHRLLTDLRRVGITVDFTLELKKYSKTYYGRYNPNSNKVTLYVYEDAKCSRLIEYQELLLTLIHEAVHCLQWKDPSFVRRKGVMHDTEFHRLNNYYRDRAKSLFTTLEVKPNRVRISATQRRKTTEVHC